MVSMTLLLIFMSLNISRLFTEEDGDMRQNVNILNPHIFHGMFCRHNICAVSVYVVEAVKK